MSQKNNDKNNTGDQQATPETPKNDNKPAASQPATQAVIKASPKAPKATLPQSKVEVVKQGDLGLINDLNAALQQEKHRGHYTIIYLLLALVTVFLIWAYNSPLDEITRGQGSVIPTSREQIVQSLDPGIIKEMKVKEGDIVEKGQVLLTLDDTRSSAVLRESEAKVNNLTAIAIRLRAEAYNMPLEFPDDLPADLVEREREAYNARARSLKDAVASLSNSKALLDKEIAIASPMVARGLMSEVELLRMKRQSSDLQQQISERRNKYKTDANNELVQIESELAQAEENMAMRADPVERSQIRAPLRGIVKNIRINTVGGVVQAGQDILEIVPTDEKLLIQAYISPRDVAFIRPGQEAIVKISAYDYAIYGGLEGKVVLISPDTLQDERRKSELKLDSEQSYYRILVETTRNNITDKSGKVLEIAPGMTATVDIKTGQKTVFQYLIKPITRMKQALQER